MKLKYFNIIIYLIAYCLLGVSYYIYIHPIYGYTGFDWLPKPVKMLEGAALVLMVAYVLPVRFKKPSDLLLHIHLLFPILPMLVLYGVTDLSRIYVYYTLIGFGLIIILVNNLKLKVIRITFISPLLFQRILIFISGCYILSIISFGGLSYLNFNFSRVYELRSAAASVLPEIYAYLSPMISKVVLPFSLLLAILNKDRFFVILSILGSVFMFALTNHKGPLFYPIAVLALYYLLKNKNVIPMLIIGYISLIIISIIGFEVGGLGDWVGSLFLRRTYFVPAHINFLYYDYFSVNAHVVWAESKLTFGLINYPYDLDVPHLIGREYYSNEKTGANTGWIGSGYMQLGFVGMLIYSVIIGFLFSLIDSYSKKIDKRVIVAISLIPMLVVMHSSDLPTAFLTHGVILCVIFFSIFAIHSGVFDRKKKFYSKSACL